MSILKFDTGWKNRQEALEERKLPSLDGGYYDTLVAVGYAALVDSYYGTEGGPPPIIIHKSDGYLIKYQAVKRETPDLAWLKYSIAASWKKDDHENVLDHSAFKDKVGDQAKSVKHYGTIVDTSTPRTIFVEIGTKRIPISAPARQLYGTLNKLGSPRWLNAAIYLAKEHGSEILDLNYSGKLSFNSIVLPQGSKGGNSGSAYSIANGSLSASLAKQWTAANSLAAIGLIFAGKGNNQDGFSLPFPKDISLSLYRELVDKNRRRLIPPGLFYPYSNYLYYLKLVSTYQEGSDINNGKALQGVGGAKFIELGTQSSPAGNWFLAMPGIKYSIAEIDRIDKILYAWRKSSQPKAMAAPNIDRSALAQFMRGFERSEIHSFLDGFLTYLRQISFGANGRLELLDYSTIIKIMASKPTYHDLVQVIQSDTVAPLIKLIRNETYYKAFNGSGKDSEHPNYQLIRQLLEVSSKSAFVNALLEISITQSKENFIALKNRQNNGYMPPHPTEEAIATMIGLADSTDPKLLAKLLLAFGMARPQKKDTPNSTSSDNV